MAGEIIDGGTFAVPGYRDVSQIGRGASSSVFKAYDSELSRWVAIKVLLTDDPDDPARRRFKREGEITANLGKHPHIVQVLGTGFSASGNPYVVMEYFEQGSISDHLRFSGAFPLVEALDVGEKIADAVSAAHRAGVLHRDIKPQNILLSEYGPALGDFGIARTSANLEWSQSLDQLTPMHAAPEVLLGGTSTVQSDLYSLGSTIYTMLAGRAPFAGPPGEAPLRYQVRVMQEKIPPIPRADVPPAVTDVLNRSLAKNPAERFSSAEEFRAELATCLRRTRNDKDPVSQAFTVTPPSPNPPPGGSSAPPVQEVRFEAVEADISSPDDETRTRRRTDAGTGMTNETSLNVPTEDTTPSVPRTPTTPWPQPSLPPTKSVETAASELRFEHHVTSRTVANDGELTVSRPRAALESAPPVEEAEKRRSHWLLLAGIGGMVGLLVAVGAVFLFSKQTPARVTVKKIVTLTTTDIDRPTPPTLVRSGSGAELTWSDPTAPQSRFLVIRLVTGNDKTTKKPIGETTPGITRIYIDGVDPSTTRDCFLVIPILHNGTRGAGRTWCPTGFSVTTK